MIDPQPNTPIRLTFEAQDTVTNVAEPTAIDHGSHNVTSWSTSISRKRVNRRGPNSDWGVEERSPPSVVVERGNVGVLEETGTAGCGAKGPEITNCQR